MSLVLRMEELFEQDATRCTIDIGRVHQVEAGPPPPRAIIGDDWLSLQGEEDALRLQELGYWELEPEGLAMKFMRLAWIAAHEELRRKYAPFDGDPRRSWERDG